MMENGILNFDGDPKQLICIAGLKLGGLTTTVLEMFGTYIGVLYPGVGAIACR